MAEVDINDIPTFYLTDNCYWLYPLCSACCDKSHSVFVPSVCANVLKTLG